MTVFFDIEADGDSCRAVGLSSLAGRGVAVRAAGGARGSADGRFPTCFAFYWKASDLRRGPWIAFVC